MPTVHVKRMFRRAEGQSEAIMKQQLSNRPCLRVRIRVNKSIIELAFSERIRVSG